MKTSDDLIRDIVQHKSLLWELDYHINQYKSIQCLCLATNVEKDFEFRKQFASYYRMRFPTPEYRDQFFKIFETTKKERKSFVDISSQLYKVNSKHEFSFITKMIHTLDSNSPIYDSRICLMLGIKRLQSSRPIQERIKRDEEILKSMSALYSEIGQDVRVKEIFKQFNNDFPKDKLSVVKKIDFILWAPK